MPEGELLAEGVIEYEAVLLYNKRDIAYAEGLYAFLKDERKLRIWFAPEDLEPGNIPAREIFLKALPRSRAVVVCIGEHDIGNYQSWEIGFALERAIARKSRLIPVLFSGSWTDGTDLLWAMNPIDLRWNNRDPIQLEKLYAALHVVAPEASSGSEPLTRGVPGGAADAVTACGSSTDVGSIFQRFADNVATKGMTVFLGGTLPERHLHGVPNLQRISADLLSKLGLLQRDGGELGISDPLMSSCHSAFVFALKNGEPAASTEIPQLLALRSVGEPATYMSLAGFLKRIHSDRNPVLFQSNKLGVLVVTTNVDLSIERAFLRTAVPFTRVVISRNKPEIRIVEIQQVRLDGDKTICFGDANFETKSRSYGEIPSNEIEKRHRRYEAIRGDKPEIETFLASAELDRALIRHFREREREGTWADLTATRTSPIILKLYGSFEIDESCVTGIHHYYTYGRNAGTLPASVQDAIKNRASLFVGLNLTEPHFVHLYESRLAGLFGQDSTTERVAIIQRPLEAVDGQDRIDVLLQGELGYMGPTRFKIRPLDGVTPDAAFLRLAEAIGERQSPWD